MTADWPEGSLDVQAIRASGMVAIPFQIFVVKVHSRCNLACDYCYVYEMADDGWRRHPLRMSDETVAWTIRRIAEHVRAHNLTRIKVILHGGEPLLAGAEFIAGFVTLLREALPATTRLEANIQTNGVLLDESMLTTLVSSDVSVGVSLDGDATATDRHRNYADGRSSHAAALKGIALLNEKRFRTAFSGILAAVDLRNDPLTTYSYLLSHNPPKIDFLLPHGTWSMAPPGLSLGDRLASGDDTYGVAAPYANWLLPIFDRWYATTPAGPSVRLFSEIIQAVLGGLTALESVGLAASTLVVIGTDGAIRQLDSLSAAYDGAAETGLTVAEHTLDAALDHPGIVARQLGGAGLSPVCQRCSIVSLCGGGLYSHRYSAGSGFLNPSVYCADLFRLIGHIRDRVHADISQLGGHLAAAKDRIATKMAAGIPSSAS